MNKRYIMLFNYDTDEYGYEMIDAIKSMFPEAQIENYTVSRALGSPTFHYSDAISVWIPEDQFLAAWMFVNMYYSETEPEISDECVEEFLSERTIQDGVDYMNEHLRLSEFYVKFYKVIQ